MTLIAVLFPASAFAVPIGSDGWSQFTPSADTQIAYVSSSEGDDLKSGASPLVPVRTLSKGISLFRNGYPDWLLLKRGDTWNETLGVWLKSGESSAEPMLVSTYGDSGPRPRLLTGLVTAWRTLGTSVSHLAVVGIECRPYVDPNIEGGVGAVVGLAGGQDLLLEDCLFSGYGVNVIMQSFFGVFSDFRMRRCVITDAFSSSGGHSQGLYADGIQGILIEGCLFDHNGWNASVPGGEPTIFNHNIYIQVDCTGLVVRDNIIARASSHGIQARPGGIVEQDLFVRNPLAISFGYVNGATPVPGGVTGNVSDNVILEGGDIDSSTPRGYGITVGNTNPGSGVVLARNILAHDLSAFPYGIAFEVDGNNGVGVNNVTIRDSIVFDWRKPMRVAGTPGVNLSGIAVQSNIFQTLDTQQPLIEHVQDPSAFSYAANTYFSPRAASSWFWVNGGSLSFPSWVALTGEAGAADTATDFLDPFRTAATYNAQFGGPATFDAFIQEARSQSRWNWRPQYTASAINVYIRNGFQSTTGLPYLAAPFAR